MEEKMLFLVKFGKREHMQQIVDGKLRFSPSQVYINLEKEQHDKGQGDLLEGKLIIKNCSALIRNPETGELLQTMKNVNFELAIEDVNNMPIHCMSMGTSEDCVSYINENQYKIKFNEEKKEAILHDFNEADTALIILQPIKFIDDLKKNYDIIAEPIKYFSYDMLTIEFLTNLLGIDKLSSTRTYPLYYNNRYRYLLSKDIVFKDQSEFRFILLNESITEPNSYDIDFKSKYIMVNIDEFFNGVDVNIRNS